jgi:hypothetical protein
MRGVFRHARRVCCLVLFSLLTSAATAYAECAWVLWQHEIIDQRDVGWTPRASFNSISDCKVRESNAGLRYYTETQKLEVVPSGYTVCLPDSVEAGPRSGRGARTSASR